MAVNLSKGTEGCASRGYEGRSKPLKILREIAAAIFTEKVAATVIPALFWVALLSFIVAAYSIFWSGAVLAGRKETERHLLEEISGLEPEDIAQDTPIFDLLEYRYPRVHHTKSGARDGYTLEVAPISAFEGGAGVFPETAEIISLSSGSDIFAVYGVKYGVICNGAESSFARRVLIGQNLSFSEHSTLPAKSCKALLYFAKKGT